MEQLRTRYPGAQPFAGDELSSFVFFGRDAEIASLTDQIIVNRLVIVFAKSGAGKTSLLQAGVSPLREAGYAPLVVRVNDVRNGPLASVLAGIENAARRQGIEYQAGDSRSMWHFFRTAEFWRGDLLQTPFLILDQFEELFTLHAAEVRARFIAELGYLVRGVMPGPADLPAQAPADESRWGGLSDSEPAVRIVVSMREDFIGSLEEAAERIPQILDHRFRLAPLSKENAALALRGPSGVENGRLASKPFTISADAENLIISHLSRRSASNSATPTAGHVEPFELQLVCQRIENIAMARQGTGNSRVEILAGDFGQEKGLASTLQQFYTDVLKSIPSTLQRRKIKKLCNYYLISPTGRRLSLEESEVERLAGVRPELLSLLVNRRLPRCEQHADSRYYEISHDSLVIPILAASRITMTGSGALGFLRVLVALSMCILAIALPVAAWLDPKTEELRIAFGIFALAMGWIVITWIRKGVVQMRLASRIFTQRQDDIRQRSLWFWLIAAYAALWLAATVYIIFFNSDSPFFIRFIWLLASLIFLAATWMLLQLHHASVLLFFLSTLANTLYFIIAETQTPQENIDLIANRFEASLNLTIAIYVLHTMQRLASKYPPGSTRKSVAKDGNANRGSSPAGT